MLCDKVGELKAYAAFEFALTEEFHRVDFLFSSLEDYAITEL